MEKGIQEDNLENNDFLQQIANAISLVPQQPLTGVCEMVIQHNVSEKLQLKRDLNDSEITELGTALNKIHSLFKIPIKYVAETEFSKFGDDFEVLKSKNAAGYFKNNPGIIFVTDDSISEFWLNFCDLATRLFQTLESSEIVKFGEAYHELKLNTEFKITAKKYRNTFKNGKISGFQKNSEILKDYRVDLYESMLRIFNDLLIQQDFSLEKSKEIIKLMEYRGNV